MSFNDEKSAQRPAPARARTDAGVVPRRARSLPVARHAASHAANQTAASSKDLVLPTLWQASLDVIRDAARDARLVTSQALKRHPRRVAGAVLVSSASFAVTAFGIAPLAPDAAKLPQRVVVEAVALPDIAEQRDALSTFDTHWYRSTETRASDTMPSLFKRLGIDNAAAVEFARADPLTRKLIDGRGGKRVRARTDDDGRLIELIATLPAADATQAGTHFTRLSLTRGVQGHSAKVETVALVPSIRMASGTIRSTLFDATDTAQVPDSVASQIAEIFSSEIDFHRELRRGDTFHVVYETLLADGEPLNTSDGGGRVLAAEFVNKGEKHEAVWFSVNGQRGDYYDFEGNSRRRAMLASPLEFSRVTSGFSMRFHPIHKSWHRHLGTDYAAPTGTPARSVGDGVVDFAGVQGGYGNVVIVKHSQNRTTLYAHLSRIDVRTGQAVSQGQTVGAVGSTGSATGPHLHFEFRVNGEHQDPVAMAKASEMVALAPSAKAAFKTQVAGYVHRLELSKTTVGTRTRIE